MIDARLLQLFHPKTQILLAFFSFLLEIFLYIYEYYKEHAQGSPLVVGKVVAPQTAEHLGSEKPTEGCSGELTRCILNTSTHVTDSTLKLMVKQTSAWIFVQKRSGLTAGLPPKTTAAHHHTQAKKSHLTNAAIARNMRIFKEKQRNGLAYVIANHPPSTASSALEQGRCLMV